MKWTAKRMALGLICLALIIGVGAVGGIWYLKIRDPVSTDLPSAYYVTEYHLADVIRRIQDQGLTPEAEQAMGLVARRYGASAVYVLKDNGEGPGGSPWGRVEAAYPPQLVGSYAWTVLGRLGDLEGNRFGGYVAWDKARVTAPDGTRYAIYLAHGSKAPTGIVVAIYAVPGAALLAWLSVAFWVYFDARERRLQAAGWGLLGVLAGPLALAVWLIYRRNNHAVPTCGACGRDLVEGALYCAHCGQPCAPGCPNCHRPVQPGWRHCVACGTDLEE
jgi:hypothetical protein